MAAIGAKDARIDFRLPSDLKEVIEQAATLRGQSLSDFAVSTLVSSAHEVIQQSRVTELSNCDRDIFISVIDDADAHPNEALIDAAREYKAWLSRSEK